MTIVNTYTNIKIIRPIKRRLPSRKVRFNTSPTTAPFECSSSSEPSLKRFLTAEEISSRWYTKNEQQSFKKNVVRLVIKHTLDKTIDSFPRGVEAYARNRMKQRKSAIRSIVGAYKLGVQSETIASLSRQKSRWHKEVAETQGCIDFIEVLLQQHQPAVVAAAAAATATPLSMPPVMVYP